MRNLILKMVVLFSAITMASCASYFLKKNCESTNWFQYGEKVALNGQRLDEDDFISQCRKVEANIGESNLDKGFKQGMNKYCLPDQVYMTGRNGEFFNPTMCDGSPIALLKQKHAEGVKEYCMPTNAFTVGAGGKKYNKICPPPLEKAFTPEFNRGRKQYLAAVNQQKKDEIEATEKEISTIERQKTELIYQLSTNQNMGSVVRRETHVGPNGAVTMEQVQQNGTDPQAQQKKDELNRTIQDLTWKINSKHEQQRKLRQEIGDNNTEMAGL